MEERKALLVTKKGRLIRRTPLPGGEVLMAEVIPDATLEDGIALMEDLASPEHGPLSRRETAVVLPLPEAARVPFLAGLQAGGQKRLWEQPVCCVGDAARARPWLEASHRLALTRCRRGGELLQRPRLLPLPPEKVLLRFAHSAPLVLSSARSLDLTDDSLAALLALVLSRRNASPASPALPGTPLFLYTTGASEQAAAEAMRRLLRSGECP